MSRESHRSNQPEKQSKESSREAHRRVSCFLRKAQIGKKRVSPQHSAMSQRSKKTHHSSPSFTCNYCIASQITAVCGQQSYIALQQSTLSRQKSKSYSTKSQSRILCFLRKTKIPPQHFTILMQSQGSYQLFPVERTALLRATTHNSSVKRIALLHSTIPAKRKIAPRRTRCTFSHTSIFIDQLCSAMQKKGNKFKCFEAFSASLVSIPSRPCREAHPVQQHRLFREFHPLHRDLQHQESRPSRLHKHKTVTSQPNRTGDAT